MNVSEYIINKLELLGVKHVFCVTGGGSMYLNEALRNSNIKTIFCHHEQAATMAAIGYSKLIGAPGVVMVTSGCASTNTITGLLDAYQDDVQLIVISGDSWLEDISSKGYGVQGSNIKDIVSSITGSFLQIDTNINYIINEMLSNIKYPLWINIPVNYQNKNIVSYEYFKNELLNAINASSKPLLVLGHKVKKEIKLIKNFIDKYNIPFCTSFHATDILNNHSNNIGRIGIKGNSIVNKCLEKSDLIICLGTRMNRTMIGYDGLPKHLYKILINDSIESNNKKEFNLIIPTNNFDILNYILDKKQIDYSNWLLECYSYKKLYEYKSSRSYLDYYEFIDLLSENLPDNAVVITDAGTAFLCTPTSLKLKDTQRYITSGQGDMGFTLPAAIGSAIAEDRPIIAITGDGSFQFNLQELQTIKQYNLNIKIFVINNNGYLTIRNTQSRYFNGNYFGTDKDNNISFPSIYDLSIIYNMNYQELNYYNCIHGFDWNILNNKNKSLIEVICLQNQKFGDY